MRNHLLFIMLLAPLSASSGCVQTECGDGTIERDGVCQPADQNPDPAGCGPNTELRGGECVPTFMPTTCDPQTSILTFDEAKGIYVCIGTGGGGCDSPLPCMQPAGMSKLTICGQLYDFETNAKFQCTTSCAEPGTPKPNPCNSNSPTTEGPCALQVLAFDALVYGNNQSQGNITPGATDLYIDECGRYRVSNIETQGTGPFIGLGFTEAGKLPQRPLNQLTVTATTGVATAKPSSRVVQNLEAFIAKPSTITKWQTDGGPPLSGGIYVGLFKAHKVGNGDQSTPQPGVKFFKAPGNTIPNQDFYFNQTGLMNTAVDVNAVQTGENGNGILINANVNEATAYSGTGGTSPDCTWESHAAANLANIVFFQIYRKVDVILSTTPCPD